MSFPIHDWQFWVVSVAALAALVYVLRGLIFKKKRRKRKGQRATLTIGGKPPEKD